MKTLSMAAFALLTMSTAGCSSDLAAKRERYLVELSSQIIVPQVAEVATQFAALKSAVAAFDATPNATTLTAAQTAWRTARTTWKKSEVLLLGPTMAGSLRPSIDWFPIDTAAMETSLAADTVVLDEAFIRAGGANVKGLLAVEYFLFDAAAPDQVLVRLTTDAAATRRRAYLVSLVGDLAAQGLAFKDQWTSEKFLSAFTQASVNHTAYANPREAIADVINRLVYMTEKIADMKLARPLGLLDGTGVNPALEESPRSDSSRQDAVDTLAGVRMTYYATNGATTVYSLSDLVKIAGAPIDQRVGERIAAAEAALAAIPTPFANTLATDPAPIAAAETKLRDLRTILATEVASNQGATIGFSDNDGD